MPPPPFLLRWTLPSTWPCSAHTLHRPPLAPVELLCSLTNAWWPGAAAVFSALQTLSRFDHQGLTTANWRVARFGFNLSMAPLAVQGVPNAFRAGEPKVNLVLRGQETFDSILVFWVSRAQR
ncbi:hypothetical protein BS50DRAFT_376836 [Corynespora cassiicola Philippines]|uniref:Uncharacterized protein n=1 Tax=Corynespora cassiicola Philippines TaxID=1448308 RepID=A0A2T2NN61_CORCC|nr:hypothetical protein BS50DRAFT_376836 [Corynespora cassiicola Philippines]